MTVPPSLTAPVLDAVWDRARERLERRGEDNRGRIRLPELTSNARLALAALVGRPIGATIDLATLEKALAMLGVGDDLAVALARLGHPVSAEPARRRAERQTGRAARAAARAAAMAWPEPWAETWIDEVIRAGVLRGMDVGRAVEVVAAVRTVLDRLAERGGVDDAPRLARVELAADLFGSAHALDPGTRIEAAATRALGHRLGTAEPRELWERAGAHLDLTSGPALTWRLPVTSTLGALVREASALRVPLHLTQFMLKEHPVAVSTGADILVVENPRVVEAAVQMDVPGSLVATNGNPSGAVQMLLDQLLASGATLRYHGDFDTPGLTLCARMARLGLVPWRMDTARYLDAVAEAEAAQVELPVDEQPSPPTPWDPELCAAFDRTRLVVHEERLLPALLDHP